MYKMYGHTVTPDEQNLNFGALQVKCAAGQVSL